MAEIITIGETMAVMVPDGKGRLSDVDGFGLQIAGAESNTATGIARLGHEAAWISSLGADELGYYVLKSIEKEGVDVSLVNIDKNHRTGLMLKEFIGDATTVYYYRENSAASHLSPESIPFDKINDAKIIHLTGITPVLSESCREAVGSLFKWAKECGKLVSFDPNIRRKIWYGKDYTPMLREMLESCDIALLGLSEARELYGIDDAEKVAKMLTDKGVKYVAVKDGGNGALCATADESVFLPPEKCNFVDSVGAGDGFNSGFLVGILEGKSLREAGRMGAVVGAMATETVGDVNGYPTREILNQRMETEL